MLAQWPLSEIIHMCVCATYSSHGDYLRVAFISLRALDCVLFKSGDYLRAVSIRKNTVYRTTVIVGFSLCRRFESQAEELRRSSSIHTPLSMPHNTTWTVSVLLVDRYTQNVVVLHIWKFTVLNSINNTIILVDRYTQNSVVLYFTIFGNSLYS